MLICGIKEMHLFIDLKEGVFLLPGKAYSGVGSVSGGNVNGRQGQSIRAYIKRWRS